MQRIAVIDYGMGNLRSVAKAIESVAEQHEVVVTSNASAIETADKIVCPGQGAAADCMAALHEHQLVDLIRSMVGTVPFLGICMGLQVLLSRSEENGGVDCINCLPGKVQRFAAPLTDDTGQRLKVPHMGWSKVRQQSSHSLWQAIPDDARFYFAHSYYCKPDNAEQVTGVCDYGHEFAVALADKNVFACQFHPEKSAKHGLQLLSNFVGWDGSV